MARRHGFRNVTISHDELIGRMLAHLEAQLVPEGERPVVPPFSYGGRSEPVTWFFDRLGREVKFVDDRRSRGVKIQLPKTRELFGTFCARHLARATFVNGVVGLATSLSMVDVVNALEPEFLTTNPDIMETLTAVPRRDYVGDQAQRMARFTAAVGGMTVTFASDTSVTVNIEDRYIRNYSPDELLLLFDDLDAATHEIYLPFLRRDLAIYALGAWFESERPTGVTQTVDREVRHEFRDKLRYVSEFYDTMFWQAAVSPLEPIRRFLPPGSLPPRQQGGEQSDEGPTVRIGPSVSADDPRVDPARFEFYVNVLGCEHVVEPTERFMNGNYVAFLLRAQSGLRVAILDCREPKNAAYVFRIGRAHESGRREWATDAVRTKQDVLARADAGEPTTFMRRFCHTRTWQTQVRRFLETH